MACCDDCGKSGGSCGDAGKAKAQQQVAAAWSVGAPFSPANIASYRVGAYATPEAEDAWKQGVTLGWVGGAGTVLLVLGSLWILRGR